MSLSFEDALPDQFGGDLHDVVAIYVRLLAADELAQAAGQLLLAAAGLRSVQVLLERARTGPADLDVTVTDGNPLPKARPPDDASPPRQDRPCPGHVFRCPLSRMTLPRRAFVRSRSRAQVPARAAEPDARSEGNAGTVEGRKS